MDSSIAKAYFEKFSNFVDEFITGDIFFLIDDSVTNTFTLFLLEFPLKLTIITRDGPSSIEIQLFAGIERDENDNLSFSISPQSLQMIGNFQHCNSVLEYHERFLSSYSRFSVLCLSDIADEGSEKAISINKTIDLDFIYRIPSNEWNSVTYDQLFADVKKDITLFYTVAINEIGILPSKIA